MASAAVHSIAVVLSSSMLCLLFLPLFLWRGYTWSLFCNVVGCVLLRLLCLFASVYMCIVVTCWERADLLALVCGVQL